MYTQVCTFLFFCPSHSFALFFHSLLVFHSILPCLVSQDIRRRTFLSFLLFLSFPSFLVVLSSFSFKGSSYSWSLFLILFTEPSSRELLFVCQKDHEKRRERREREETRQKVKEGMRETVVENVVSPEKRETGGEMSVFAKEYCVLSDNIVISMTIQVIGNGLQGRDKNLHDSLFLCFIIFPDHKRHLQRMGFIRQEGFLDTLLLSRFSCYFLNEVEQEKRRVIRDGHSLNRTSFSTGSEKSPFLPSFSSGNRENTERIQRVYNQRIHGRETKNQTVGKAMGSTTNSFSSIPFSCCCRDVLCVPLSFHCDELFTVQLLNV